MAPAWKRLFVPTYKGVTLKRVAMKTWTSISANVKEMQIEGPFQADLKHDCARLTVMLDVIGDIPDARRALGRAYAPY
jgi:hypothetical protein